jgi:hypothetical protein
MQEAPERELDKRIRIDAATNLESEQGGLNSQNSSSFPPKILSKQT